MKASPPPRAKRSASPRSPRRRAAAKRSSTPRACSTKKRISSAATCASSSASSTERVEPLGALDAHRATLEVDDARVTAARAVLDERLRAPAAHVDGDLI